MDTELKLPAPRPGSLGRRRLSGNGERRNGAVAAQGLGTGSPYREEDYAGEYQEDEDGEEYDDDAFGTDIGSAAGAEVDEWDEVFADPLMVRFTQEKIHPFFYRRGPIVNVVPKIRPVLRGRSEDGEEAVVELVPPFNPIHCLRKGEDLWSLDNRRLYALQLAAMEQWPQRCRVRLLCRDRLPRHKFKTQYRKFNTTSEGRSISVCARYQQFDTWSWFDRAVEVEWYTFSQRLGALLSVFEILPVIGALLFRTGLTGFNSRLPLVAGFVLAFALDLLRQKVPAIERRLCELHVQAILDGEVRPMSLCCRRLRHGAQWLTGAEEDPDAGPMSPPQLSATMALALALLLPYVLSVTRERLRSSLLSCWLGIACVLAIQLGTTLRGTGDAEHSDAPECSPPQSGSDPSADGGG